MWDIQEHRSIERLCRKLPRQVVAKYELWKDIVYRHGPEKLREFPGFHDEQLKGRRTGQRSSRLSLEYRVIYLAQREQIKVFVIEITPHKY